MSEESVVENEKDTGPEAKDKGVRKLKQKRWVKICGGLLAAVVLLLLLLPVGAKYYLVDWLEKNGAESATIKNLRYNPFVGKLMVGGVAVQQEGRSTLQNSRMVVDLGLTSLFSRDIRLEKAEYQDLSLELEQYADGRWRFGSYTMAVSTEAETEEPEKEPAKPWFFHADQVVINNCTFHLKSPELDLALHIEQAELNNLSTRPDQPAGTFTFKGKLNEGPISLQLNSITLVPELRVEGELSVDGFKLGELAKLLADVLPTFAGELGLKGQLLLTSGEGGLLAEYDGAVNLQKLDVATGELKTAAEGLSWNGKLHYGAAKQQSTAIETDGLFSVRGFTLQLPDSGLMTEEAAIDLSGKTIVSLGDSVSVKNDGSLKVEGIELVLPPYNIVEQSLSWQGTVQFDAASSTQGQAVSAEGLLELGGFQVGGEEESELFALGGKMVSWQGALGFKQQGEAKGRSLSLDGTLNGGELLTTLAEPQLRLGQGKVAVTTKTTIRLGENLDIKGTTSLNLNDFTFFEGKNESPTVAFSRLNIAEVSGQGGKVVGMKELLTEGLRASVAGTFPLEIDIPELSLSEVATADLASFSAATFSLKKPLIKGLHNQKELVRLDELKVEKITFNEAAEVGINKVLLQNLAFLASGATTGPKSAASFSKAELTKVSWSQEAGFAGDTLQLTDLLADVVRDEDGNINISKQLAEMQAESSAEVAEAPAKAEEAQAPPAPFKLNKVVVAGKSALSFEDYTLKVPYKTDLAISKLEVTSLDSRQADKKTELFLQGQLEKRAPIEVSGHLFPFKAKPGVDMQLGLKNYPLSSLSAYTVQSVGTALASGQLQLNSKVVLAEDKLDMSNDILLKKLETETISPELAAELNNQLPISLDAALSILRDSDKNISLKIPLSGPVSELKVGVADVMITALGKAILPAASGYLMYALGPYGALAYVGMKVGEKVLQVSLPPVIFVQQEIVLTKEHNDYLQRVGKILQDRPDADVQICPQVGSWELLTKDELAALTGDSVEVVEEQKEPLLELGQQRAKAVQQALADDYGIELNRLLICDTKIKPEKKMKPAVLLQL